jgi:hypothetical protein
MIKGKSERAKLGTEGRAFSHAVYPSPFMPFNPFGFIDVLADFKYLCKVKM